MAPPFPRQFGKYVLLEKIATGGMAELLKAKITGEHGFEKILAVKKIHSHFKSEQDMLSAFIDEARLAAQLQHQNIVQVVDFGHVNGDYFIAMEYLDGLDLATILRMATLSGAPLAIAHALYIVAKVCDGLHYAHFLKDGDGQPLNIVHRDISPANIFITHNGEIKVIDFGIARAASHNRLTVAGSLKGKIRYMAPEQTIAGKIDRRVDIYAIGAMLYEILSGRPLFKGNGVEILELVKLGHFTPPEQAIPNQAADLYRLLHKSLAADPEKRYPSCLAMLTDIESCLTARDLRPSNRSLQEFVDALPQIDSEPAGQRANANEATQACEVFATSFAARPASPPPPSAPPRLHTLYLFLYEYFHAHLPRLAVGSGVLLLLLLAVFSMSKRYTAFNIWVPADSTLSSVNYKGAGDLLPAGSPIDDLLVDEQANTITFHTADQRLITIHFVPKWHPGLSVAGFAKMLASAKDFRALTRGMSKAEIAAIKAGSIVDGMSKDAVLVAYGVPPEHGTTTLEARQWTYWRGRFTSQNICFDDNDELLPSCSSEQDQNEGSSLKNLGGKLRDLFEAQ